MPLFLRERRGSVEKEYREIQSCFRVLTRILTSNEVQSTGYGKKMKHYSNERISFGTSTEWIISVKHKWNLL